MYSEVHPSYITWLFMFTIVPPPNVGNKILKIIENTHVYTLGMNTRPPLNTLLLPSNTAKVNSSSLELFVPLVVSA